MRTRKTPTTGVSPATRRKGEYCEARKAGVSPASVVQASVMFIGKCVAIVTDAERFAGETPALFAKQSAFGDCQAAQRTPSAVARLTLYYLDAYAKNTDAERFAGETPALQAAQRTPSVVARLCNVRLRAGCDGANWVRKTEHTGSLWLATLRSELRKSPPPVNSQARLRLGFGGIIN